MKKSLLIFLLGIFSVFTAFSQQTMIKGSVKDAVSLEPLPNVTITIEETQQTTTTDGNGEFSFTSNVPLGEQVLQVSKSGYITARYPIVVNEGRTVDITDMSLKIDVSDSADLFTVTLSDDELNDDTSGADNISGLLQSSRDVFYRTAAFEFSSSFFRIRGLDSENGTILINGIEMNKMFNGRPQWSNWGGLNDVVRNQEFTNGITPSAYNFGGILGTTNIDTRASHYRRGGRVTYSSSNRSYTNRLMASYASGLVEGGWAYTLSIGRRWGNEGYQDATLYDANSFFASVEKKINDEHSINLTGIYAPNRRGKSSPNTQEVYDLKGIKYNEYWGWQDGEKRNSRIKRVVEPIIMLNHYWTINDKTTLNTNIGYQFGELGNSRLDYNGSDLFVDSSGQDSYEGGGANPSPTYYQKLPSFFLADTDGPDLAGAYGAEQNFLNDGQIDWGSLYQANLGNAFNGGNAIYALYEDRSDDTQITFNSILSSEINENILLNASVNYKNLKSENFAEVIDLLGASTYLDVDGFAPDPSQAQNDDNNPNRVVGEGDKFKYNYDILANVISGYAQAQFKYNKVDFYVAGSYTSTQYQRDGKYRNGRNLDNSFGKGDKLKFNGIGAKGGATYKITGKHLIDVNAAYLTKAPSIRNTFTNSRENHDYVGVIDDQSIPTIDLTEEKITSLDASYIFRSPIVKARLTGFYTTIQDANEISFFFTQGGSTAGFLQEILAGVDKKHFGGELGIEAQVTPTIKLKAAASVGQYTYDNNPQLYFTSSSEDFANEVGFDITDSDLVLETSLKDYKVAGGPQRAASVGFEYRDPDFWWVGATANFFSNAYLDISPLSRSERFYQDADGLPFNDYDPDLARELLRQEKFDDYMVVNAIGGKSWKIDDYFVGFFASINNILDKQFKTGGYEQGRRADFRTLRDDVANPKRVFGPKYWYGRGTTYFLNVYLRF